VTDGFCHSVLFVVSLISFSTNLHRARIAERRHIQENPFTNVNYETGDVSGGGAQVRPKGGFQSEVA
jgi:hypothetical protein